MSSNHEDTTDSALYLVPNPDGRPGKTVVRRKHAAPTTVAMDDDFDAITAIHTEVNAGGGLGSFLKHREIVSVPLNEPTGYDDASQYGMYMKEMRGGFGGEKIDMELKGSRRIRIPDPEPPIRTSTVGGVDMPLSATSPQQDQSVPMVRRKILEDGPDRTVTLWRHEVEGKHNYDHDESPKRKDRSRRSGEQPRSPDRSRSISTVSSTASSTSTRRIPAPQLHNDWGAYTPSPSVLSDSTMDAPTLSSIPLHVPAPHGPPYLDYRTSSSTATARSGLSESTVRVPPPENMHTVPAPRGGISSHRTSASSVASDVTLSTVLDSCQPSLAHVAPLLEGLGIRGEDGLRALAGLSAETRDREVKEEALGRGITVVEWAVLVDLLKRLGYTGIARAN